LEKNAKICSLATEREQAIAVCAAPRRAIVARDERETGERALLNLGHTFGHALDGVAGIPRAYCMARRLRSASSMAFDFSVAKALRAKRLLSVPRAPCGDRLPTM